MSPTAARAHIDAPISPPPAASSSTTDSGVRWLLIDEARGKIQQCTLVVDHEMSLAKFANPSIAGALTADFRARGYRIVRIRKG